MTPRRAVYASLAVLSVAVVAVSSWSMAHRVAAHNESNPVELWYFRPIDDRVFTYAGREVRITDQVNDAGEGTVTVSYGADADGQGGEQVELRVAVPSEFDLPGLGRHKDWLRVLTFAPNEGLTIEEFSDALNAGELTDRLVVVARQQRPGAEPGSWGAVWRRDWMFDFHELVPDGTIVSERLSFPESTRSYDRRRQRAMAAGEDPPERRSTELRDGTWQFSAALWTMPSGSAPDHDRTRPSAIEAAGWTLPATSLSILASLLFIALAAAPRRVTEAD